MVASSRRRHALPTLSDEEAWDVIDQHTRAALNMSAQEFIERWQAGQYTSEFDDPRAFTIAGFLPMVGIDPWAHDGTR